MIGVIVQARMGATRLPGKVLKKLGDNALLDVQISRIKDAKSIDAIVVATTLEDADDEIAAFCKDKGIPCFRGSESDVLSRYYECAREYKFDTIVRLTADCPLIDPVVIDKVVALFFKEKVDYCSNTVPPETSFWPDGSDVEVFSFAALERAQKNVVKSDDREHVTFFFWKYKSDEFKTAQLRNLEDWSRYRFTVDYQKDYEVIRLIYDEISLRQVYGHVGEIVQLLDDRHDIRTINEEYYFGIGWEK